MLSIIIPYRNREIRRLKNCLASLNQQTNKDFFVYFVDYGSNDFFQSKAKKTCTEYSFVKYNYCNTKFQPWNKSRALNSVIRKFETGYFFVADVDLIFHPDFVNIANNISSENLSYYFQVGFLSKSENYHDSEFSDFSKFRKSTKEATGLSLFPVNIVKQLRGFDEFYHLWGAEDTDLHVRIKNAGYSVNYYNKQILLLHQWHESYRNKEKRGLEDDIHINGIARFNHRQLDHARKTGLKKVNPICWGVCPPKKVMKKLEKVEVNEIINSEIATIDHFLFSRLPSIDGCYKIRITPAGTDLKREIKKFIGRDIFSIYTLKEVKNKLLLHIINFYRDEPYLFKMDKDMGYIEFAINRSSKNVVQT